MAPVAEDPEITGPGVSPPARPGRGEFEQLEAENELLRTRLASAETVAREREQRIEDLVAALQGLPRAWVEHLERTAEAEAGAEPAPGRVAPRATVIEVLASRPGGEPGRAGDGPDPHPEKPASDLAAAEAAWKEVLVLKDRLERERLDRELEGFRTKGKDRSLRRRLRQAS